MTSELSKADPIKVTLEIWPVDGEAIEDAIGDAIRRAVPGSDPCTIGVTYTGFRLDESYYSADTPAELMGLYVRAKDGRRVEPLTVGMEFSWKADL